MVSFLKWRNGITILVHESLTLLGELLEGRRLRPLHLVVSGGSALLAAEIVSRTTHDVDVIADARGVDGDIIDAYPLLEFLKECVREVAEEKRPAPELAQCRAGHADVDLRRFPPTSSPNSSSAPTGMAPGQLYRKVGQIYLKFYAAVAVVKRVTWATSGTRPRR